MGFFVILIVYLTNGHVDVASMQTTRMWISARVPFTWGQVSLVGQRTSLA